MTNWSQSRNTFALTVAYCVVVFLLTTFRLFVRGRSRWGWDDFWAAAGMLCFLIITIQSGLFAYSFSKIVLNQRFMIALFYLESLAFSFGVWAARMSILYSLRRMSMAPRTSLILRWVTLLFYVGLVLCVCQVVINCEVHPAWKLLPNPFCAWTPSLPPTKIASAVISDGLLVILPFLILRDLKSAPVFRTRLLVIFSASTVFTISSVVQSIALYSPDQAFLVVSGITETFVGLVVCNLSVVITASLHLLGVSDGLKPPAVRRSSTSKDMENGGDLAVVDDSALRRHHQQQHQHLSNSTFNTMDLRFATSVPSTVGSKDGQSVLSAGAEKEKREEENGGVIDLDLRLRNPSSSSSDPSKTSKTARDQQHWQTRSMPSLEILKARWRVMDVDAEDERGRAQQTVTDPSQ